MVKLKDIAKVANVNVSTVSKALRGCQDLNEQTITSIQEIASAMGYEVKNDTEQKKRNRLVGVVVPELVSGYYSMILDSLCTGFKELKYDVLVMQSGYSDEEELHCVKNLIQSNVSSVVLFSDRQIKEESPIPRKTEEYSPIDLSMYLGEMTDSATNVKQDVVTTNHSYERWGLGVASLIDGTHHDNPRFIGVDEEEVGKKINDLWIRFDLKDVYRINRVLFYSYSSDNQGLPKEFSIETSKDGQIWKTVYEETDHKYPGSVINECRFAETEARYVRMNVYQVAGKCDVGEYVCLREVEICGEKSNAAKTVPPTFTQIVKNAAGVSFLLVSSSEGVSSCDSIWCDEMEIVGKALNHLYQLGHRRIAFIGDRFSEGRKNAFLEYMRTNNLPVPAEYVIETESRFEKGGAEGLNRLLTVDPFPSAVFTVSDETAIGVISAAAKNGIAVPDGLSVVSVMDTPKAKYMYPSLTTVRVFGSDIGGFVTSMVIGRSRNPMKKIEHVRMKPRLIFRESSAFLNSGKT